MKKINVSGIGARFGALYENEAHLLEVVNEKIGRVYEVHDENGQRVLWHKGWNRATAIITPVEAD